MSETRIPFDLQRALAGDKVESRNPEIKVLRIIHVPELNPGLRVGAVVKRPSGNVSLVWADEFGKSSSHTSELDLFMAPREVTVWVSVYRCESTLIRFGGVYTTQERAIAGAEPHDPNFVGVLPFTCKVGK